MSHINVRYGKNSNYKNFATSNAYLSGSDSFDINLLPDSIRDYAEDVARRMNNAPISFAATTALLTLSSAIGRRVGVRPKLRDDWTVIPNLWGMLIAPPSVKKSPIFSEMTKPLISAEEEAFLKYRQEVMEYERKMDIYKAAMKKYNESMSNGEECVVTPKKPEKPTRTRYIINDATIEKVADIMESCPMGLALIMDELAGWLSTLNRAGREADRAFWLEAYNGNGSKVVDRISRGTQFVPYVCASIFGTIQPDALMALIQSTKRAVIGGDGLLQRFQLMVMEDRSNSFFVDEAPNVKAREMYEKTVLTLLSANPEDYGAKKDFGKNEIFFRFSENAVKVFKSFSVSNQNEINDNIEYNPAYASHLGKYDSLFASLALILFYSDRVMGITKKEKITAQYALRSEKLCNFYKAHAAKIYDMERIKDRKKEAMENKVIEKVKELEAQNKLPKSFGEISQLVRGVNASDVEEILKSLVVIKGRKVYGLQKV